MFSCASLNLQYSYTVLYRNVHLCLITYTVFLHCTLPLCSAVPQYIYSKATLNCAAVFSSAPLHIQYSYTALYRHVELCFTIYTVVLQWTLQPYSAVSHYINSISTLHFTALFSCVSLHIQHSYTVLDRHVQLRLTTYTVYLHCNLPPCSAAPHNIYSISHWTVPPCSAVPLYIYIISTLYCTAMLSCASLHIQ